MERVSRSSFGYFCSTGVVVLLVQATIQALSRDGPCERMAESPDPQRGM